MKALRRVPALFGIAMGAGALLLAASTWWFISRGPFPDGVIHTKSAEIPFVWSGEMTWKHYAFVATTTILGITLMVVSYRFGFRRHAEPGAAPNGGPAAPRGNQRVTEGPPSVI